MIESDNMPKKNNYDMLKLYGSCALLLFSGIILGGLMLPWDSDIRGWVMLFGIGLFVGGFILLGKRDMKITDATKTTFDKLEKRIEKLENQNNTKSDNQQPSELS